MTGLKKVADEIIATTGCESNVKEIYDETWNLRRTRPEAKIFNQFAELANTLWHYEVTGNAMQTVIEEEIGANGRVAGVSLCSGSAGTLGFGDFIKDQYPGAKIVVGEALQCSTLYDNGFGDHRIEGIGDKHVLGFIMLRILTLLQLLMITMQWLYSVYSMKKLTRVPTFNRYF